MKAFILSRYGRLGASSRLRMFQFEPYLKASGLDGKVARLFDDRYLENLYAGRRTAEDLGRGYFGRIFQLLSAKSFDVLWIEKEALPWMPWWAERALLPQNVPIVTDYDDATFHSYDLNRSYVVRYFLGKKIDAVMADSAVVMAGNAYLAERALAAGAKRVLIVPTVVDTNLYSMRLPDETTAVTRIGWIGTPSTWKEYMRPIIPALTAVAGEEGARLTAIGAETAAEPHAMLDLLPWSEAREVDLIQGLDIGIMPLIDTPWARGKCGYKLIQYMACGLPVIASPVGVNAEIVDHGVNGFLATTEAEWQKALRILLRDPDRRRAMGAAGRAKVEAHYSLQVWGPRVAQALADVARQGPRCSI